MVVGVVCVGGRSGVTTPSVMESLIGLINLCKVGASGSISAHDRQLVCGEPALVFLLPRVAVSAEKLSEGGRSSWADRSGVVGVLCERHLQGETVNHTVECVRDALPEPRESMRARCTVRPARCRTGREHRCGQQRGPVCVCVCKVNKRRAEESNKKRPPLDPVILCAARGQRICKRGVVSVAHHKRTDHTYLALYLSTKACMDVVSVAPVSSERKANSLTVRTSTLLSLSPTSTASWGK
jgi:hypothetical protein